MAGIVSDSKIMAIKTCLEPIINEAVSDDIINYILTFANEEDYDDFMENMVDRTNSEHLQLYNLLKTTLFASPEKRQNNKQQVRPSASGTQSSNGGNKGRKSKFTNFHNYENKTHLRKGRQPCECQATRHELINNCTKCGRIVCEQEGSGPCFFCGNMVCTRQEQQVLSSNTKDSERLHNALMEQKTSKEWKRAIENRNRLLDVDQMGSAQNKVFDDQSDYFDLNSKWINDKEKSDIKKRFNSKYEYMHKTKREFKLALDFASRTVSLEDPKSANKKQLLKGVNKLLDNTESRFPKNLFDGEKKKLIQQIVKLMEESSLEYKTENHKPNSVKPETSSKVLAANNELLESIDQGMCLSMHQPWASLLVAGIKVHEGRTWPTEHRGRLWIAAAAKEPEDDEILACEEMYRVLYNDETIEFPKKYPTKCLLGCVFVEDCLPQSVYREKYGEEGESNSPFVLICSNPVILPIFYPMQGQHKIFQISKELHRTAKAALMSSKWV